MRSKYPMTISLLVILFTISNGLVYSQEGRIRLIAGISGDDDYSGDGQNASESAIGNGLGIDFLDNGHLVFCTGITPFSSTHRIGAIDLDADTMYTIFGNGTFSPQNYNCVDIIADEVATPSEIFIDSNGDIYF
jgi:hypothetical protein